MRQPPVALACLHEKAPVQASRDLVAYTVHVYIYICISCIYTHLYAHTDTHTYTYHWLEAPLFLLRTRTLVQTGQCGKKGAWVLLQLPAHLHAVCVWPTYGLLCQEAQIVVPRRNCVLRQMASD